MIGLPETDWFSLMAVDRSGKVGALLQRSPDEVFLDLINLLHTYRGLLLSLVILVVFVKVFRRLRQFFRERDVEPVPYTCLYVDADVDDFKCVLSSYRYYCRHTTEDVTKLRESFTAEIQSAWTKFSSQQVITCLSLKTALDLFLRVQKYPSNSEIILTAINSPDIARIIVHHGLKVVPLDIGRHSLAAHSVTLGRLFTDQTVAILFTHLFGNTANLDDAIELAYSQGIHVLEDCSQCYDGPDGEGNPESDLVFYDFDVMRSCTAFGGSVVKVKDSILYNTMKKLQDSYPIQREWEYVTLAVKTVVVGALLRRRLALRFSRYLGSALGFNVVDGIKEFLITGRSHILIRNLREQPSTALLSLLAKRFTHFDQAILGETRSVSEYVCERLPPSAGQIGSKAMKRGYWLFPILVDEPDKVIEHLNKLGVNATRSIVDLQVIAHKEHDQYPVTDTEISRQEPLLLGLNYTEFPPDEARDIMERMIFLPVHKHVTQYYLDEICLAVEIVLNKLAILRKYKSSLTLHGPYGPILTKPARNASKRKQVSFSPTVTVRSSAPKNHKPE